MTGRRRVNLEGPMDRSWERDDEVLFSLDFLGVPRPSGSEPEMVGWWRARWRAWCLARATGRTVVIRAHRGGASWVVRRVGS